MTLPDGILRFEHDHAHLNELVLDLSAMIGSVEIGSRSLEDVHPEFGAQIDLLREDLFLHFAREEEGLFPFVRNEVPDLELTLSEMCAAHDGICGAVARMNHLVGKGGGVFGEQLSVVVGLFRRFEVAYTAHAHAERALLQGLAARLGPEQRRRLAELVRGL